MGVGAAFQSPHLLSQEPVAVVLEAEDLMHEVQRQRALCALQNQRHAGAQRHHRLRGGEGDEGEVEESAGWYELPSAPTHRAHGRGYLIVQPAHQQAAQRNNLVARALRLNCEGRVRIRGPQHPL